MKTFLFIDSVNQSVMMVNAETPQRAAIIAADKTTLLNDHYMLVATLNQDQGNYSEATIV
jgi:hypothetical protein